MTFYVGQPVICVDASGLANECLKKGASYAVMGIEPEFLGVNCCREHMNGKGYWFKRRFRPIVSDTKKVSFTEGAPKESDRWDNRKQKVRA